MPKHMLVHIVDDEEAVRVATGFLLEAEGFEVRLWKSGNAFLDAAPRAEPGCVLLDVRMADIDGLEVQQRLLQLNINMPIIMITGHGDIGAAVRSMRAGAVTFLEKPPAADALFQAIREGLARLDDTDSSTSLAHHAHGLIAKLSKRERDVLNGLTRGLPNKYIAYDLDISPRTVEIHRANLMAKLGVRSLSDALKIAFAADFGTRTLPMRVGQE